MEEDCWMKHHEDKELPFDEDATVTDMRFKNEGKMLRLYMSPDGDLDQSYYFDIDLMDYMPAFKKSKLFEDRSLAKYGKKYIKHIEPLEEFIEENVDLGNELAFPEKDPRTMCVLDKQDA